MKKITLLILCILLNSIILKAGNKTMAKDTLYPTYKAVIEKYFKKYNTPESENEYLTYAKKPDGWHVLVHNYYNDTILVKDELFWSRNGYKYLTINFPPTTNENIEEKIKNNTNNFSFDYNIEPYYGYPSWEIDVINEYENRNDLTDNMLESLARAYSSYASNLVSNNTGLSDYRIRFKLQDGSNCLTQQQLDTLRKYHHLSAEVYAKLLKRNPKYKTFIGGVFWDYNNAFVNSYMDVLLFQNEQEAKKELHPDLYDATSVAFAENFLNGCTPNAILFVSGDNDTYPLIYVQEQLDYRKDVIVINTSLLTSPRYIDVLKNKASDLFSLTHNQYKSGGSRDYISIKENTDESDKFIELKEMMDYVKSEDTLRQSNFSGRFFSSFPSANFKYTIDKSAIIANNIVSKDNAELIADKMEWTIKDKGIQRNILMFYDFLATNNWKRPICFSITCDISVFTGFDKYLQHEGVAYRLVPILNENNLEDRGRADTKLMYENLMNKFNWGNLNDTSAYVDDCKATFCMNFRFQFSRLAKELVAENKKELALKVLDKCLKVIPEQSVPYDYFMTPIVETYYKAGGIEKGTIIANKLVDIYEKELLKLFADKSKKNSTPADNEAKQIALYVVQKIGSIAKDFNQETLSKRATALYDKYYPLY